jgi:catechol 2,3-dioxygenase-like lactoylglutathione lyase family enzyme
MSAARFNITGIERVAFAVNDLDTACRFAADWGLERVGESETRTILFRAVDGSEVEFCAPITGIANRTPIGDASGICEVTWGVREAADIAALRAELATDRVAEIDTDGILRSHDDLGIPIAFRIAQRRAVPFEPSRYNTPGQPMRVDRRAARYERARPHEISHLAIAVDDAGQEHRFYVDRLGFHVSDRYADRGVFMRCAPEGNHHHLFLMNGKMPGTRFGHLAFKVRDIHEVIAGGQYFDAQGWSTFAGPGRHIVSSANFWYFQTPFGGAFEYAADEDMVTEAWQSHDFAAEAHIFSEWTFGLEKSDGTLKGPISQSAARALDPDVPA